MRRNYVDLEAEVVNVYTVDEVSNKVFDFLYEIIYESFLYLEDTEDYWENAKVCDIWCYRNSISAPNFSQKFFKLDDGTVVRWNAKKLSPIFEDAKNKALKDFKENHNPKFLNLE